MLHAPTETSAFSPASLLAELDYYGIPVEKGRESPELRFLRGKEALALALEEAKEEMIDDITSIAAAVAEAVPFARKHRVSFVYIRRRKSTDGTDAVFLVKSLGSPSEFDTVVEGISTDVWERNMVRNSSRAVHMLQQLIDRMAGLSDDSRRSVNLHVYDGPVLGVTPTFTPALDAHYDRFLAALDKSGSP